ncbi:MAG: HIT family protein [Candidatus Parvarchaeota archaeon]|nr:HIT family protein [Candidatus Parvarchaeota archaeon]MCW1294380.1 HIT family protein [Candidatus Parvarchaeum tengchongense]MCW1295690.1 HIT family protein [Candidatus Parvarchaeum tengchongense]MCW1298761.1 HIT family protein [Candidatus Parvarchaeum tengchongense]MCW1311858.1 HIT family protein [Candidatus Parvarchaeum tengchongense]
MECVFCSETTLNIEKFYEDENFVAIYNIRPVVKGHCLVIPKRHIESMLELNERERMDFISFSNKAIFIALKYANANDLDFLLQKGENAGQSIKHLHFHIMPRKKNDSLGVNKDKFFQSFAEKENTVKTLTNNEMKAVVNDLRSIAENHRIQINEL